MQIGIRIDNVYEDGETVVVNKVVEVPAPESVWGSEEHDEWAEEHLLPHTGTGRFAGNEAGETRTPDAAYFVEVTQCDEDPAMVGNEYEWGL